MNTLAVALAGLAGLTACAVAPGTGTPPPSTASHAGAHAPSPPSDPVARIAVERPPAGSDRFTLDAQYEGPAADALGYRLDVVRIGRAGRSQSSQSGRFTATPGERQSLSTMQVNAGPGDRIEAVLTVTQGDRVIAEDRFEETVSAPR